MICKYCGTENQPGYNFCINCSASLTEVEAPVAQDNYAAQQPVQPGYGAQPYNVPPVQNIYNVPYVQQQKPASIPGAPQCALSMVFGIIAIATFWIPIVGIVSVILALVGIVNGIIGVIRSSAVGKVRPQGIVGLALSAVSIIPAILVFVAVLEEF